MEWNSDEMFVKRYSAMTYAQRYMTDEAYDNAEKWLKENEDRYVKLINHVKTNV